MTEWVETPLGSLCKFQAGDAFPKEKQGIAAGEYPFIKVSDMNLPGNERFIQRSNNWIQKADASKYRLHPPGSVVFAKIGEALRANRRRVLVRETIIDNNMMSAVPTGDINPSFLLYVLEGIDFNNISRGSALPYLAAGDLNKLIVTIPGKEVQQAIAETLSLLDQKIELNRRMNETLEGMAQAIFRDWFVDFGPVRRKIALQSSAGSKAVGEADPVAIMGGLTPDPARAAQLATLFPAAFGDDGLPVGWKMETIGNLTSELRRGISPKYTVNEGVIVLNQKCVRDGKVNFSLARKHDINARSITGRELKFGDIVVNSTGVGTLGRVAQIWHVDKITIADSHLTVIRADQSKIGLYYLGINLRLLQPEIESMGEGSTGQTELSRKALGEMKIVTPNQPLWKAFDNLATPLWARAVAADEENRTLAETRDYLLPRLMSGAVRVVSKGEAA